jgi:signal transduction histidine kinase
MASATADRFGVVAEARGLTLAVEATPGDHVVAIPPDWLDRLLGVLVDNACKFAPDGSTVRIAVATEAGRVTLAVDDAGPGIPADQRDRIFDRFHRATDAGSGAGLGLAIADGIVRATHGRWRVGTSTLGGASLAVSWPRALGESNEGPARHS